MAVFELHLRCGCVRRRNGNVVKLPDPAPAPENDGSSTSGSDSPTPGSDSPPEGPPPGPGSTPASESPPETYYRLVQGKKNRKYHVHADCRHIRTYH